MHCQVVIYYTFLARCDKMKTYVVARQHFQHSITDGRYLLDLVYCPLGLTTKTCLANFDNMSTWQPTSQRHL